MKGKSDTTARAIQLAKQDTQRALEVAGSIAEGWSRARALAWIGRFAPDADVSTILGEARESSLAANTPFKIVDSSAWWIRAMIERGDIDGARRAVPEMLAHACKIKQVDARVEATFSLLTAVVAVDGLRRKALAALVDACCGADTPRSWARLVAATTVVGAHPAETADVIKGLPEGKYREQARRRAASGFGGPPVFFK
jgi:hypothetical protein